MMILHQLPSFTLNALDVVIIAGILLALVFCRPATSGKE